jgi:tRNA(Ile)-lysidine synthase
MHKRFLSYIKSESLFNDADRILLAVSGGMDSMTLCEMMRINQLNFAIGHFNHVTRNGESDLDEIFVKNYALQHGIPFYSTRVDINNLMEMQGGGNFQNLARTHRYQWLREILTKENFQYIATAHHHNDQIETFLFHFSRGTGLDGLSGMASKQDQIVRPMLIFTRSEIETFVFENKIDYRVDSSNSSNKYSRNYIRHGIIPSFKILNENFESNANTTIENLRSTKILYSFLLEEYAKEIVSIADDGSIELNASYFDHSDRLKKQLCFELIRPYGFNYTQVEQITESLGQRGNTFYSDENVLLVETNKLIIRKHSRTPKVLQEVDSNCQVPGFGQLKITKIEPLKKYPKAQNIEYVDADKIEFPLVLRSKQDGDRFKPLGMKGRTKKIKDFFTDLKLNKFEKEKALVLLNQKQVVWILGYRISDKYKITSKTKEVLQLEWIPE